jgi:hypothetical protein
MISETEFVELFEHVREFKDVSERDTNTRIQAQLDQGDAVDQKKWTTRLTVLRTVYAKLQRFRESVMQCVRGEQAVMCFASAWKAVSLHTVRRCKDSATALGVCCCISRSKGKRLVRVFFVMSDEVEEAVQTSDVFLIRAKWKAVLRAVSFIAQIREFCKIAPDGDAARLHKSLVDALQLVSRAVSTLQ